MKRTISIVLALVIISIFLAGCNNHITSDFDGNLEVPEISDVQNLAEDTAQKTSAEIIEYYVRTLTSEEFAGRMPGTSGNNLAAQWLVSKLQSFDIESYSDDGHKMEYPGWSNTFLRSEMTILFPDGTSRHLVQGSDFFISLAEGNFSIGANRQAGNYRTFGRDNELELGTHNDDGEIIHFTNTGFFRNNVGSYGGGGRNNIRTVQLSDEVFQIIESGSFDRIGINNVVSFEETTLHHVVGRIRGTNPSNAIVLSAHFDHKGEGGETFFPGALDNASGTAALLYIAEKLKIISNENPFDFDVIIAFFNSEEFPHNRAPHGSQYFVPIVKNDYENVWNINLDCVGGRDGETYLTGDSGSSTLREALTAFAELHGIFLNNQLTLMSDNINFTNSGIPSFNFITDEFIASDVAHTNIDTPDKLYFPQIVRLSHMIIEFLKQDGIGVFEADEMGSIPTNTELPDDADLSMLQDFMAVFNNLRRGQQNYFESFYLNFPHLQQLYFSYYEAAAENPRLSDIRNFGLFRLGIFSDDPPSEFFNYNLIYFPEQQDSGKTDLFIRIIPQEQIQPFIDRRIELQNEFIPIPDLEGYTAVFNHTDSSFRSFIYTYDETTFYVIPSEALPIISLNPYRPDEIDIVPINQLGDTIDCIDEYADFIRSLNFDEFFAKWAEVFS